MPEAAQDTLRAESKRNGRAFVSLAAAYDLHETTLDPEETFDVDETREHRDYADALSVSTREDVRVAVADLLKETST